MLKTMVSTGFRALARPALKTSCRPFATTADPARGPAATYRSPLAGHPDAMHQRATAAYGSYMDRIRDARVYDVAIETPLQKLSKLSARTGNDIRLKREDQQPVHSFKIRGAYNKIANLPDAQRRQGVAAASAGNHAQGLAMAGTAFGCRATIVMPAATPAIKVDAVRGYGGEVVLHGADFQEAYDRAQDLAREENLTFVHPFDDADVIAGQGTVGVELLAQHPEGIHAIFAPIGGGGLAAGIAAWVKQVDPNIQVIGVEPEGSASMLKSLVEGQVTRLESVDPFADGVAVKQVGDETFRMCHDLLDAAFVVSNDEICAAIKDMYTDTRSILEPAGALALAGAKAWAAREGLEGKTLVAIASGANMDFDRLGMIGERANAQDR